METATIICPSCGKEYQVMPEDLDKCLLTYHCDGCNSDFQVDFFDSCPNCHRPVGFLDSKGFGKFIENFGKEVLNAYANPVSVLETLKELGSIYLATKSGQFVDANGDGICPICHKRYLRCGNCHELFSIDYNLSYKDTLKCPNCGIMTAPDSISEGKAKLHSREFKTLQMSQHHNSAQAKQPHNLRHNYRLPEQLPQNKAKLMEVIAYCSKGSITYDEWSSVNSNEADQCIAKIKKQYKLYIPLTFRDLFKNGATYSRIADYVLAHRNELINGKKEQKTPSTQTIKVVCGTGDKIEVNVTEDPHGLRLQPFSMNVKDVFNIEGRGIEITGKIDAGYITIGDQICFNNNPKTKAIVVGIEIRQKLLNYAEFNDYVGLLLREVYQEINIGDYVGKLDIRDIKEMNADPEETTSFSANEREYIEELKECLVDGELGGSERRLLNKLRMKLGISEERAAELEASLQKSQLTEEEQEYLEAYQDALEDGVVSEKERRLLDKLMKINNLSEERAKEIEMLNK